MGLDQYAYRIKNDDDKEEIFYWRKHNRLQGWMERLYVKKGGVGEFNCVDVELNGHDLAKLAKDIKDKSLPETAGFFFGGDSYSIYEEGYKENDEEFLSLAHDAISEGDKVVYQCWY